jgi:hypothetical protein
MSFAGAQGFLNQILAASGGGSESTTYKIPKLNGSVILSEVAETPPRVLFALVPGPIVPDENGTPTQSIMVEQYVNIQSLPVELRTQVRDALVAQAKATAKEEASVPAEGAGT